MRAVAVTEMASTVTLGGLGICGNLRGVVLFL